MGMPAEITPEMIAKAIETISTGNSWVPHTNGYIAEFLQYNSAAIMLVMGVLRVVATLTPWAEDNKVVTMLQNLLASVMTGKGRGAGSGGEEK